MTENRLEEQHERAVLVGLSCPGFTAEQDADERTMDELRALAETAGAEAVAIGEAFFVRFASFYIVFGLAAAIRGYVEGSGDVVYSSFAGITTLVCRIVLSYALVGEEGPEHDKQFIVEARLDGRTAGHGKGRTKKAAEQQAAYQAILFLRKQTGEDGTKKHVFKEH